MKIWLAPSAFFPHRGGVEELTGQLARELGGRGHDVLVLTNRHPRSLEPASVVEDTRVRRIPFTAPNSRPRAAAAYVLGQPGLQRTLDALLPRPEVVHIQCPSSQTTPLVTYALRHRIALVLTSQGEVVMDEQQLYQHSRYMRLSFRAAARSARVLTACSAWTAQQCRPYSSRFERALIIENGVDPGQWQVGPVDSAPVLCAWGRHVRQKGFDLAIAAFARLREQLPDARLLIGGEGTETPTLRSLAGPGVEFLGPLDRSGVKALLGASRVAVVPSRVEPFGIVALEALAAGRGLVYAAGTGLSEAAGTLGRAADVYDPADLAHAMLAELADPTSRAAGEARARELSWAHIADRYLDAYEQALGR